MTNLIVHLMECKTSREVDVVVEKNIFKLSPSGRSHLCIFANKRKRTLMIVKREAKKSWSDLVN